MEEYIKQIYQKISSLKSRKEIIEFIGNNYDKNPEILEQVIEILESTLSEKSLEDIEEIREEFEKETIMQIQALESIIDRINGEDVQEEKEEGEQRFRIVFAKTEAGNFFFSSDIKEVKREKKNELLKILNYIAGKREEQSTYYKKLNHNSKLKDVIEFKTTKDQIRVFAKKIRENTFLIFGVVIKKDNWESRISETIISRMKTVNSYLELLKRMTNEELQLLIEESEDEFKLILDKLTDQQEKNNESEEEKDSAEQVQEIEIVSTPTPNETISAEKSDDKNDEETVLQKSKSELSEEEKIELIGEKNAKIIEYLKIYYKEKGNLEIKENEYIRDPQTGKKVSLGRQVKFLESQIAKFPKQYELVTKLILEITQDITWINDEEIKRLSKISLEQILAEKRKEKDDIKNRTSEEDTTSTEDDQQEEIEVLDINEPYIPATNSTVIDHILRFDGNITANGAWDKNVQLLKIYYDIYMHLDIPEDLKIIEKDGTVNEFGKWFQNIINKDTMSEIRIKKLIEVTKGAIYPLLKCVHKEKRTNTAEEREINEEIEELQPNVQEDPAVIFPLRKKIRDIIKKIGGELEEQKLIDILDFINTICTEKISTQLSEAAKKALREESAQTVRAWIIYDTIRKQIDTLGEKELQAVLDFIENKKNKYERS